MSSAFDQRLVKVNLDINGEMVTFEGLNIYASGRKFAGAIMAQCDAKIFNLTRDQKNYILTKATPLTIPGQSRTPIKMSIDVGRESYGTFRMFEGDVLACGATQPPDIGIFLKGLANNFLATVSVGVTQSAVTTLSTIAKQTADSLGLKLDFQATDKNIDNYSFTGSALRPIDKLEQMGGVQAFTDNGSLIVIDSDKAKAGAPRLIDSANGMVGVPQVTDYGVVVKVMIDNSIQLGGNVVIRSEINPAVNGSYKVIQMNFEIANREDPFWYTLSCSNLAKYQGQ